MFDRYPDAHLVGDLVSCRDGSPHDSAASAACALIEEVMGWQAVASWVEWNRLDTMRRFAEARRAADIDLVGSDATVPDLSHLTPGQRAAIGRLEADLDDQAGRFAAEELALGLNMSVTSVEKQLTLARDLGEVHRDLGEALEHGQVSGFVAAMVAQATRKLPDEARRALDAAVTVDATEQPPGRAIDAARTRVSEVDPYTDILARAAANARHVFLKPLDDGVAMLGAILPADDAIRVYRRLDSAARTARTRGDPRTLDQLRADSLVDLVVASTDGPSSVEDSSSRVGASASTGRHPDEADLRFRHRRGPADRPQAYQPSNRLRHAVGCRDRHCRMPVCTARVRHLDHIQARLDHGLTTTDNLHGLCERSHLAKHHPGWTLKGSADASVMWTTPTGHTYASTPPPVTGVGTGPPGDPDTIVDSPTWLSRRQADTAAMNAWRQRNRAA